jgi:predicted amidohydrolase YtcJ
LEKVPHNSDYLQIKIMRLNMRISLKNILLSTTIIFALSACNITPTKPTSSMDSASTADAIYFGGDIVTMNDTAPRADAIAILNGRVLAVGSTEAVMQHAGDTTEMNDLGGKTLVPGFIDAHSHLVQQSMKFSVVNLDPDPIGDVKTMADLTGKLMSRLAQGDLEAGQWLFGWGYDDTGLSEQRHPTRADLDAVSTDHPIALMHISNHLMAVNSKALELAGITAETPDPAGGKILREEGGTTPSGVLEETALFSVLGTLPAPTPERAMEMLEYGVSKYAAAGITTAQDGASTPGMIALLNAAEKAGKLPIDVVAYPLYATATEATVKEIAAQAGQRDRFRMGGIKLAIDGSIQGYTAYLSKPYYVEPLGAGKVHNEANTFDAGAQMVLGQTDELLKPVQPSGSAQAGNGYRGYPSMVREDVARWIALTDAAGIQLMAHTNGDAAIDILIDAVRDVRGDKPRPDLRTVIIHAQTIRDEQLDFAAANGLVPSFFPIHVPFWGDRHKALFLGPERAARIDPARSALERGMWITLHMDAPVAGINILGVISAAVNRRTTGGEVLGEAEKLTPAEAMRAVTIDAARQYFEEDRKGSLEPGKLADMVILDQNPLKVKPMAIKDIKVLETIKEGKSVYTAK